MEQFWRVARRDNRKAPLNARWTCVKVIPAAISSRKHGAHNRALSSSHVRDRDRFIVSLHPLREFFILNVTLDSQTCDATTPRFPVSTTVENVKNNILNRTILFLRFEIILFFFDFSVLEHGGGQFTRAFSTVHFPITLFSFDFSVFEHGSKHRGRQFTRAFSTIHFSILRNYFYFYFSFDFSVLEHGGGQLT